RRRLLQEPSSGGRNVSYQVWCCMSCKHELLSSSESFLSNLRIENRVGRVVPAPAKLANHPVRLSAREREIDLDRGIHVHRLAIQDVRLVTPLFDGVNGCLCEQRMAADHVQILNGSILADDCSQLHGPLHTRGLR